MKLTKTNALAILLLFFLCASFEIGEKVPLQDYVMRGVDGNDYSIEKYMGEKGLIVIFSCNTCPFVVGSDSFDGWEKQYNTIYKNAKKAGINVLLVNSNEAKRNDEDSFDAMVAHAKEQKYKMPYVLDERSKLADAFAAKTTPHVFLIGSDFTLKYKGTIDNTWNPDREKDETYVMDIIKQVKTQTAITITATAPKGCSIKRLK